MASESESAEPDLLDPGDLQGAAIGVSVSESPDLEQLGLVETHLRLVLAEIARLVMLAGGSLVYGGHLDPDGYTAFLRSEIEKYGSFNRPLTVCLAWTEHRRLSLTALKQAEADLGRYGRILYLDPEGVTVDRDLGRGEDPEPVTEPELEAQALTAMRRVMVDRTDARVFLGGRRSGYAGRMPGLLEEALLAVQAGQPLFLAGGFGGMTQTIAGAVGLDPADWGQPLAAADEVSAEAADGLKQLATAAQAGRWHSSLNSLDELENRRLGASHRPGEVASLVTVGLRRMADEGEGNVTARGSGESDVTAADTGESDPGEPRWSDRPEPLDSDEGTGP